MKSKVKSVRGYIGGVLYTNRIGFHKFIPCDSEKGEQTSRTLKHFIHVIGLPYSLHCDNHANFKQGLFSKLMKKFGIFQTFTEPHSPWQNRAEAAIGDVKRYACKIMQATDTPIRLWCFAYEYSADLHSLLATSRFDLQGRTPYEVVMHYTPDISEYISFSWFQWCWYFDEGSKEKVLCRWLGPAHQVGQSFCFWILKSNSEFIARSTVIPVPEHDLTSNEMKERRDTFMRSVEARIGNAKQPLFNLADPEHIYYDAFDDDVNGDDIYLPYGDELQEMKTEEVNDAYLETLDEYIGAEIVIPGRDGLPVLTKVKKRKRDASGVPIGESNPNPILDTRIYEVEFPDGRVEEYSVNVLAENLLNQADRDGWDTGLIDEIVDHRVNTDVAIPKSAGTFETLTGQTRNVVTTKGWDIQIQWKDGSTNWLPLNEVKESCPIELAEYAIANKIDTEPAFKWWIKHALRNRDRMIGRLQAQRIRKGRMKFGIEIPGTVEQAIALDAKNGNSLWQDAIKKEMKNARVAFSLLPRGEKPPVGYKEITCHLVFDLKLDMTQKARYVAGGHLTDVPASMTYSSVVSRDTVRIGFLVAALNDLGILAGDIQNAFLEAPVGEKIFFYAGEEWGADRDRIVKVVRALYGLKSSALQFRNHLAETLGNRLGFKSSLADPDLWYKPSVAPDGFKYYSYILVYVDDLIIIDKDPRSFMEMVKTSFTVKPSSIEEPTSYLGADITKLVDQVSGRTRTWTMGSANYCSKAIKNLKSKLKEDGFEFNKKLSDTKYSPRQPFSSNSYRPELDTSLECSESQITLFQNLIGTLRWIVELGRIDIAYEVSVLSRYLVQPRTGHLVQALHIFKYLDIHKSNKLAFNPEYVVPMVQPEVITECINLMKKMYPDAKEELPPNAPTPRGNPVEMSCFVDSDHAGDTKTRRSQTGIILYLNKAPIIWYSKRQATVESSTFGSEFVALRVASELIISMRYKLRMFGIPITGPCHTYCDNESVYKNTHFAHSTLKKKHNSICFHRVRETVAAGIMVVLKVKSEFNLADILTKSLPPDTRKRLRGLIMVTTE